MCFNFSIVLTFEYFGIIFILIVNRLYNKGVFLFFQVFLRCMWSTTFITKNILGGKYGPNFKNIKNNAKEIYTSVTHAYKKVREVLEEKTMKKISNN